MKRQVIREVLGSHIKVTDMKDVIIGNLQRAIQ
jgi:hypothetical protein